VGQTDLTKQIFILESHDSDNQLVELATALAPIEDERNYTWFLGHCLQQFGDLLNNTKLTLSSDRHKVSYRRGTVTAHPTGARASLLHLRQCYPS